MFLKKIISLCFSFLFIFPVCSGKENRKTIDDCEAFSDYENPWNVSGGPETNVQFENQIKHGGNYSIHWDIKIDHDSGEREYPVGWLFLNKYFPKAKDWSGFSALEFFMYVPENQRIMGLKYGLVNGNGKTLKWNGICLEGVVQGQWNRITLPLCESGGNLRAVTGIRIYLAERWFPDKEKLDLYFDDFALCKGSAPRRARKADSPLEISEACKKIKSPRIYPVAPLEFVYPDSDFSSGTQLSSLKMRVAKNETASLTFAVMSGDTDIRDLDIKLDDLKNSDGGSIPSALADVRVVKVWEQAAQKFEVHDPENDRILIPELLLKDDRIPLNDRRGEDRLYQPIPVLKYKFGTDIPKHTLKQIWVNITIPRNIPAGDYKSTLIISSREGMKETSLPIMIRVLPFELPEPELLYGLYYRWHVKGSNLLTLSPSLILKDFRAFKKAHINSLVILYNNEENIGEMFRLIHEAGLKGPVTVYKVTGRKNKKELQGVIRLAEKYKLQLYFYGIDEPSSEKHLKAQIEFSRLVHSLGSKVMTACIPLIARELLEQGVPLDWANLSIADAKSGQYVRYLRENKIKKYASVNTLYWQVYEENPTRNRLLAGFYIWDSKLNGVVPYEYQGLGNGVAYSNDTRTTGKTRIKKKRIMRAWCLMYPSLDGPVSTLQWEGFRMGIDDVRYLTYLKNVLKKARKEGKDTSGIENELKMLLKPFTRLPDDPSVLNNPYVAPEKFGNAREHIIDLIMRVKALSGK